MKEETIERTSASGSNKEAAIIGVKRERNLRLKEWNPAEDDPRTIRPTLRSTLMTASIHAPNQNPHSDPRLLQSTQTHEERTKNREQRERRENRGRPSDHNGPLDHIGPMTIGPPLPNQNHHRTKTIAGSHPLGERREKGERKEKRELKTKREL